MQINIMHGLNGAKEAEGLVVVIDVFRAFSLEAYIMDKNPRILRPVADSETPLRMKEKDNDIVIIGERHAIKIDGYDFGNSPTEIKDEDFSNKIVYHTTSAGTQGIANAIKADEIITGSLVNAKAIAEYIKKNNYDVVSLVAMGKEGLTKSEEDELCALYIKSVLEDKEFDMKERLEHLRYNGGKHFFEEKYQSIIPRDDFYYCTDVNKFNFVLKIEKDNEGYYIKKINM